MCVQKIKGKAVFTALSITLMGFGHAANAAIILLDDFRQIDASAFVLTQSGDALNDSSIESPPVDFSDFDDSVEASVSLSGGSASAVAQQTSQISTTSFSASGEATANVDLVPELAVASADGITTFHLWFELTTPYLFDLSGILGSSSIDSIARVTLRNNGGDFNISINTPFSDTVRTTPFDLSGTLFPDTYSLEGEAHASAIDVGAISGSSNFSLDMQFAAVPIPASLLLFGSGLIGLVGMARGKKTA